MGSNNVKNHLENASIEDFFLKAKDEKDIKHKEFEKSSLENDFLIV